MQYYRNCICVALDVMFLWKIVYDTNNGSVNMVGIFLLSLLSYLPLMGLG